MRLLRENNSARQNSNLESTPNRKLIHLPALTGGVFCDRVRPFSRRREDGGLFPRRWEDGGFGIEICFITKAQPA